MAASEQNKQSGEDQKTGYAIVITNDDEFWQGVQGVLDAENYAPIQTEDLDDFRSVALAYPPAVIVADAAAFEEDPLPACRRIGRTEGCEYIPLFLHVGGADAANEADAYDSSVTAILKSPFDEKEFTKRIRSIGDTGRTISGIRRLQPFGADILSNMPDAFFILGNDGCVREYLGGAAGDPVLGPSKLEGKKLKEVWPAVAAASVGQAIRRVIRSRDGHILQVELGSGGTGRNYELRLLVQGRDRVMMIARDLSSGQASAAPSSARGIQDTLTGLTAKDLFMQGLDEAIADASMRERGLAILCLDIDRFSRINETLGRQIGDAVLQVAAKRMSRCLREYDKLARIDDVSGSAMTRISGDEFVLLLAEIESRDDVATVATRITDAFETPLSVEGHEVTVSMSIGIAQFPMDGANAEELLGNARVALNEARVISGNAQEFFTNTMKFRSMKRLDVKNELEWAIDKEQLEVHYLPRIDLESGKVAGLEALLRWIHPLRGSVPLKEVIPLAEATGLILAIGEWVTATACKQVAEWRQIREDVPPVAVNLSQSEFMRDDIADLISAALKESGLPPELLELELTEGLLLRNRLAETRVEQLHRLGVGIVLDDFGQGVSSVANLTRLPLKAIKIDRAFVEGVREPGPKQAICAAMIAMSRELGFTVIAEGVESQLQVEFLRERGCNAVQGFLFSEPMAAGDVLAFLDAFRMVTDSEDELDLDTVRTRLEWGASAR